MKKALLIAIAILPFLAFGRDEGTPGQDANKPQQTIVSVSAKATDVRSVLADLFAQAKKNFVVQPGIQFALYLSLDKVAFEDALDIICKQANLTFMIKNEIYFVSKKPIVAAEIPKPKGTLDKAVLDSKVTTKLYKTDIRVVFAELAKQANIEIEVHKSVPNYKLDAVLSKTSLKYAFDKITDATGLKVKFTDHMSIEIYKPDENKVTISGGE